MKVLLEDLIEAIEYEGELLKHYYNKKTGVIVYEEDESTSLYKVSDIDHIEDFEEWEQELIYSLCDIKNNPQDYIPLPNINELDEYKLMVEFCNINNKKELVKDNIREIRRAIEDSELINEWYKFRENKEKEIAINWCKINNIELE